jgi:nucleotide-binding universal stress UspA family protein
MPGMKILLALDGSQSAARATKWVATVAPQVGADVVAVHVVEQPLYSLAPLAPVPLTLPPDVRDEIGDELAGPWTEPLRTAGVRVETVVSEGPVVQGLIHLADKFDVDLVVVGRRGRGGFSELLLGSVSHQLAHHVGRPLTIVP